MRVTTNAILRDYRNNLNNALTNMNTARNHVLTQRKFNSTAENPAAAARAAQLERRYLQNQDHMSMLGDVKSRLQTQEDALMQINSAVKEIGDKFSLEALNATNGEDERKTFAAAIRQYQKSMVLSMNSSYENSFVFAGTDGKNPPFELSEDGKTLLYRGLDVNSEDPAVQAKLKEYAEDPQYVDLGFGLTMTAPGQVSPSSAFNISIPGIKALGFGKEKDGASNNIISLAGQLADELEKPGFDKQRYETLMAKFQDSSPKVLDTVTRLGVDSKFLETTEDSLKDTDIQIQTQMQKVAGIEMPQAITDFLWSEFAYNAALKVGSSILSPSFIDFMR